ncbi:hypothetical protein ACEQPO_03160 [Bacillus sp. SL00103]
MKGSDQVKRIPVIFPPGILSSLFQQSFLVSWCGTITKMIYQQGKRRNMTSNKYLHLMKETSGECCIKRPATPFWNVILNQEKESVNGPRKATTFNEIAIHSR